MLEIQGYDVILGMDWLAKHKATMYYEQKLLTLVTSEGEMLIYRGTNPKQTMPIISTTPAKTYLCGVKVVETQEPNLGVIPVVQEFLSVPGSSMFTPRSTDRVYDRAST